MIAQRKQVLVATKRGLAKIGTNRNSKIAFLNAQPHTTSKVHAGGYYNVFKKASDKVETLKGSFPEPPIKDQDVAHFAKARFKLKRNMQS